MKFSEEDLQSYALPLGENVKEQCLEVLSEILQTLKTMGCKEVKLKGADNLLAYKAELEHSQWGTLVLLPIGSYGNDTRGDKREPLEIALITAKPISELGHNLAFRLLGGYSEEEKGIGAIFMDVGPAKATIIRIGYEAEGGTVLCYNKKKIVVQPEQERKLESDKHKATGYSYKKLVRVVKKLQGIMCNAGVEAAEQVETYMLEKQLLKLEVEELQHFEELGLKLKYCCLKLREQQDEDYVKFFAELMRFCELE